MRKSDLEPYPLLQAYDVDPPALPREQVASASFEERFALASRVCVGLVVILHRYLSDEGKASLSPEDLFIECWMELKKRDRFFTPDRGDYTAFAVVVFRNRFRELMLQSRVVKLPMRVRVAMRGDDAEAHAHRVRWSDHSQLPSLIADDGQKEPIDQMVDIEDGLREEAALSQWVQLLEDGDEVGAVALGLGNGKSITQLAKERRCRRTDVVAASDRARERLQDVKVKGE